MELFEALKSRRSIRKYKSMPIRKDTLEKILEAARLAPSAANKQQWKFVVVEDPALIQKMVAVAGEQAFVGASAAVIAACGQNSGMMTCDQKRNTVDVAIACTHIILSAHDQGVGTCWLGRYSQHDVKKLLGVPDDWEVVALLTMGYPDETPAPRSRKPLEEIVSFNRF
ncbi:MAG: nitroreductase family protein [Christensenellales bacterium]